MLTQNAIIEKKINSIEIKPTEQSISFNIKETIKDLEGKILLENSYLYKLSQAEFIQVATKVTTGTKTLYQEIAETSYAIITPPVPVTPE